MAASGSNFEMQMSRQVGTETSSFAASPHSSQSLIAEALTERDVVSCVRDHLALWSPEEIAHLPEDCRPRRIRDGEDIDRWAFALAQAHCGTPAEGDDEYLLTKMLVFVTQAAMRLTQLKAVHEDGP